MDNQNYYDKKFKTNLVFNDSLHDASQRIIEAYLDNSMRPLNLRPYFTNSSVA
jgi:hypothetical protein